jgi:pimeloyl-ACP methyl ester carboxylesterase
MTADSRITGAGQLSDALTRDPRPDAAWPAQTLAQAIPSHDVNLNAVLYTAAGAGPHPTILLLHGLPGNEQNLDLAQSLRRAGWNVLTLHYRGSWGTPGNFSFAHCLEDAAAAIDWLRSAEEALRIDPRKLVVIGHSMGGFVAVHLAAHDPEILAICLISGVDLGADFGALPKDHAAAVVDDNVGTSDGLHILSGTSPEALAEEAKTDAERLRLVNHAGQLATRPLLLITSEDGFAAGSDALAGAIVEIGNDSLSLAHFTTDHSYSDHRIALQIEVLRWLMRLAARYDQIDCQRLKR